MTNILSHRVEAAPDQYIYSGELVIPVNSFLLGRQLEIVHNGQIVGIDDGNGNILCKGLYGVIEYATGRFRLVINNDFRFKELFIVYQLSRQLTFIENLVDKVKNINLVGADQELIFPLQVRQLINLYNLTAFEKYDRKVKNIWDILNQSNTQAFRKIIIIKQMLDIE